MVCQCRVSQEGVDLETKLTNAEVSRKNHQTFAESGVDLSEMSSDFVGCMCGIFGKSRPYNLFEDISKF